MARFTVFNPTKIGHQSAWDCIQKDDGGKVWKHFDDESKNVK